MFLALVSILLHLVIIPLYTFLANIILLKTMLDLKL